MAIIKSIKNRFNLFMGTAGANPLIGTLLNASDVVPRWYFPEFRKLPPNSLRVRVGVGGRLMNNQSQFLVKGMDLWVYLLANGLVKLDDNIVEIGSGIGRRTFWLRDFEFHNVRYSGQYTGIDIDPEMVKWCNENYDARFKFHCASHASAAYLSVDENERYVLPVGRLYSGFDVWYIGFDALTRRADD